MFCPFCGANNADDSFACTQCGKSLRAAAPAAPVQVQNYLVFAILTTVLCCLPAGIPAIVYAAQVNGKVQSGDIAGAQLASKNAKMWCWISFGASLIGLALYFGFVALMVLSGMKGKP